MPVAAATIVLTAAERHRLKKAAYGHKTAHQARMRAQVVLHAARGRSNVRIAHETGLPPTWTICWPGSTGTRSPIDTKNPPSPWPPDQPPKDFQRRPLSGRIPKSFGG